MKELDMPSVFSQFAKKGTISARNAYISTVNEIGKEDTSRLFQHTELVCALFYQVLPARKC